MQVQGVDLVLAEGAGLDGAGGADLVTRAGQGVRAEVGADVDGGEAGKGDALGVADDEVGVSVAVGVYALHIDDAAYRFATGGVSGWAVRGRGAGGGQGRDYQAR